MRNFYSIFLASSHPLRFVIHATHTKATTTKNVNENIIIASSSNSSRHGREKKMKKNENFFYLFSFQVCCFGYPITRSKYHYIILFTQKKVYPSKSSQFCIFLIHSHFDRDQENWLWQQSHVHTTKKHE